MTKKVSTIQPKAVKLAHHEVVAFAILQLGGDSKFIETEHIAHKANEIAPGRFTWVHYVDQINIHNIKTCLWNAKAAAQGARALTQATRLASFCRPRQS